MKVLTTGYWPTPQQVQTAVQLPVTAQAAFEEFKMFYLNRHTGRQLTLQGNMGDAELNAVFYPKKRETENPDQPSTSDPAPVKERKHILAVSKAYKLYDIIYTPRHAHHKNSLVLNIPNVHSYCIQ